jgi:hypothetical protein
LPDTEKSRSERREALVPEVRTPKVRKVAESAKGLDSTGAEAEGELDCRLLEGSMLLLNFRRIQRVQTPPPSRLEK